MSYEEMNQVLGDRYRAALERAQASESFWRANPIAYHVGPEQKVPTTTEETILKAIEVGIPNEEWSRAMTALDEWRSFRAAHGRP